MKRNFFFTAFFILTFITSTFAQSDDDWSSKKWSLNDFKEVRIEGGFKVVLIQGDECAILVKSTNETTFDAIKINQSGNEVSVVIDRSIFEYSRINLYITFKTLEKLHIEGGVNIKTRGYLNLNDLKVDIEGAASTELQLKAKNIDMTGEGGFLFELKGVTETFNVKISGAGHVSASELKANDVTFKVQGFGTGNVFAERTLDARIEGVGMLRYKGNPRVNQYIDGLGSVKPD